MPAIKKSNVSVRLKKSNLFSVHFGGNWFGVVESMLSASYSGTTNTETISATPTLEKVYELYYKNALVCEDADKNKLRRIGYLIRKKLDN